MPSHDEQDRVLTTTHLVKGEDLNHHQTLYGGRCVEWAVHAAYVTAQNCFDTPRPVVFMSIRNLSMRVPARLGEIVQFTGRVDYVGESTIGVRVDGRKLQPKDDPKLVVTGRFLLCTVDASGSAVPHGLRAHVPKSADAEARWSEASEDVTAGLS